MQKTMKQLLFLCVVAVVVYSEPRCTTTPPQWFGFLRVISFDSKDISKLLLRIANVSYDRTAGKMKIMDTDVSFGSPMTVELLDYQQKMQWKVENGKCTKTPLTDSMPTFGVPSDASYDNSEYIGAELPNLGVLVNEYHNIDLQKLNIYQSSYAPATPDGSVCVPILVSTLGAKPTLTMDFIYYANLTTTLPVGAFDVPPECA